MRSNRIVIPPHLKLPGDETFDGIVPLGDGYALRGAVLNRRFNRYDTPHDHIYFSGFGQTELGTTKHRGFIKCRLYHGLGFSLIVPDQLYLQPLTGGMRWVQPLGFMANQIAFGEKIRTAHLPVDISCRQTVSVHFENSKMVAQFPDGSCLYRCDIEGPKNLWAYATGRARFGPGMRPLLELFHHTSAVAKPLILDSGHFRTNGIHIQGVKKQLVDIAYAYFTPLDSIEYDNDLRMIAMSQEEVVHLLVDGSELPPVLPPDFETKYRAELLTLPVYASSPEKREATIAVTVDAVALAPQHLYRHEPPATAVYYEICTPFIHRVGTKPGAVIEFDAKRTIWAKRDLLSHEYVVLGDATTLSGLRAPYDEEETDDILKLQRLQPKEDILDFWGAHQNEELFSGIDVRFRRFASL